MLATCSLDMTSPTVDGGFGLSLSKGLNIGSRNPRRMFLAPVTEISLMVMGMDIWSAICCSVSEWPSCEGRSPYHLRDPALLCFVLGALELRVRPGGVEHILGVGVQLVESSLLRRR